MVNELRWDITGHCNLNCRHCQAAKYYEEQFNKGKKDLSTEEATIVIDKIAKSGVRRVGILGGEPLVRKDIFQLLEIMNEKGLRVSLNTNLTLLEDSMIEKIFKNVEAVFVSIDGTCSYEHDLLRGKGTFEKTIKNLEKLIAQKGDKQVNISYVLNAYNIKSASRIYDFFKNRGIDTFFIDNVHRVGNADSFWDDLSVNNEELIMAIEDIVKTWDYEDEMLLNLRMYTNKFRDYLHEKTGIKLPDKLVWDAPGKTSLYVLNDGTVIPAHFLAYSDIENGFKSKSLLYSDLEEIMESETYRSFLNLYDSNLPKTYYKPCAGCEYRGKQCNPSPVSYWLGKAIPMDFCMV